MVKDDPHPSTYELAYVGAVELLRRLDDGEVTSRQIVGVLLERTIAIDQSESVAVHAVAALSDDALRVADERDEQRARGEVLGALHGVPVLIKDNIEALGLPGCAGSTALAALNW